MNIKKEILNCIKSNDKERLENILEKDSSALSVETVFGTWLHVACDYNRLDIVKKLVELGLDVNKASGAMNASAIEEACSKGHIEIVKYLLEKGAVLDTTTSEANPLFSAIYGGHVNIVKILIYKGIDISRKYLMSGDVNMDAYNFAIERGELEIANLIKEKMIEQGLPVENIFKNK